MFIAQKEKMYFQQIFLLLAKERHYCVLLFFLLIVFYIFDKSPHYKKCGSTLILNSYPADIIIKVLSFLYFLFA